jgi:hypothetical protein
LKPEGEELMQVQHAGSYCTKYHKCALYANIKIVKEKLFQTVPLALYAAMNQENTRSTDFSYKCINVTNTEVKTFPYTLSRMSPISDALLKLMNVHLISDRLGLRTGFLENYTVFFEEEVRRTGTGKNLVLTD